MTRYKGYVGQFSVNVETGLIRGMVVNTRDVITFHGSTVPEAEQAFRDSVDEYLAFCEELGRPPEKPYSGKLLVRLTPKLHQELDILARSKGKSINAIVTSCLARMARRRRHHLRPLTFGGSAEVGQSKDASSLSRSPNASRQQENNKSARRKKAPAQVK
jgi:predicted HicB family RNase H-like nuclease